MGGRFIVNKKILEVTQAKMIENLYLIIDP